MRTQIFTESNMPFQFLRISRAYSRIKEEGAALYPFDIEKYIEHKSPFVEKIYSEIGI